MINKVFSLVIFILVTLAITKGATAAERTITFTPPDNVQGIRVSVIFESGANSPRAVPFSNGVWTYNMPQDDSIWRFEPTFIITLPKALVSPLFDSDMEVSLPFSIAMDAPSDIEVPIAVLRGIGEKAITSVESMPPRRRYEQIQLAQQISQVMRQRDSPRLSQRLTQLWFDRLYNAIVEDEFPLKIDSEMMNAVKTVYGTTPDYFRRMQSELRSTFWRDHSVLNRLVLSPSKCRLAAALVKDIDERHLENPEDAQQARINAEEILLSMKTKLNSTCLP
ncbi:hypothetical protein [Agrobacterium rosae]|uniref:Uncharacterized protein n=1 Tax=Agrobacterium rosae TaxID=1972867 RepID=A0A1R3TPE6_9HYPH|nr:hypothetical protein [Agrobacterium rosae]SCX19249.1 hypothetical protein DSM25559_1818 [Agrobacterium rosae]